MKILPLLLVVSAGRKQASRLSSLGFYALNSRLPGRFLAFPAGEEEGGREGGLGWVLSDEGYFLGRPVDGQQLPKGKSDFESVGAAWATCEEVEKELRLRGSEPKVWVPYVARGKDLCFRCHC